MCTPPPASLLAPSTTWRAVMPTEFTPVPVGVGVEFARKRLAHSPARAPRGGPPLKRRACRRTSTPARGRRRSARCRPLGGCSFVRSSAASASVNAASLADRVDRPPPACVKEGRRRRAAYAKPPPPRPSAPAAAASRSPQARRRWSRLTSRGRPSTHPMHLAEEGELAPPPTAPQRGLLLGVLRHRLGALFLPVLLELALRRVRSPSRPRRVLREQ